jgi:hypothetical protein
MLSLNIILLQLTVQIKSKGSIPTVRKSTTGHNPGLVQSTSHPYLRLILMYFISFSGFQMTAFQQVFK